MSRVLSFQEQRTASRCDLAFNPWRDLCISWTLSSTPPAALAHREIAEDNRHYCVRHLR